MVKDKCEGTQQSVSLSCLVDTLRALQKQEKIKYTLLGIGPMSEGER